MKQIHYPGMPPRILYAGDDDIDRAAQYLGTLIHDAGYSFDYVPSSSPFPLTLRPESYDLIIISDYPAHQFTTLMLEATAAAVRHGSALLMIGGWESFHGSAGEYAGSILETVLPVSLKKSDDRRNLSQGCIVLPAGQSVFSSTLPWTDPPLVGGFNEFTPKAGSHVLLTGRPLRIRNAPDLQAIVEDISVPLLVSADIDSGFAVALAFDLAPHWVGGFVDWGNRRVRATLGDGFIEVGELYHDFILCLITFCLTKGTNV